MALEIGVIGLGRMGTEIAAKPRFGGTPGLSPIAVDQTGVGELAALGIRPTMKLENLAHCDTVISVLPDDNAVRGSFLWSQWVRVLNSGARRNPYCHEYDRHRHRDISRERAHTSRTGLCRRAGLR